MIFYLSCTGNTRWAAELASKATGERLINILGGGSLNEAYQLDEGERIGFCFPVHGWRPPVVLREFISRLVISNAAGHYCYAITTAGDTVGEAIGILRKDLAKRGIPLDSSFSLLMPESYVGLPFMDVDPPERETGKKAAAAEKMKRVLRLVTAKTRGVEELTKGRWPKTNSRLLGGFFTKFLITDKPFRVTADKCVGCGACSRACPTGNISIQAGGLPQWGHVGLCLACFSCYHHCPTHAIEYGNRTKNKGQYFYNS